MGVSLREEPVVSTELAGRPVKMGEASVKRAEASVNLPATVAAACVLIPELASPSVKADKFKATKMATAAPTLGGKNRPAKGLHRTNTVRAASTPIAFWIARRVYFAAEASA